MMSMSMKSGTSNSLGSGCLVGLTVGLAVGVEGVRWQIFYSTVK